MDITRISKKDIKEVSLLIKKEFSYIASLEQKNEERMLRPEVLVFVAREKNELVGFIDLSLFGDRAALNGFSVKKKFRNQGFGQKILEFGIGFLQEIGAQKIRLLVKKENLIAKKMYFKAGFNFIGLHPKKIDNAVIEEYELENENQIEDVYEGFVS